MKVTRAPKTPNHNRVSIGQIHDGDDLVQIMYDGKKKVVGYTWDDGNGNGKWQPELLIENYAPGDRWFTYRIEVQAAHGPHAHRRRPGVQAEGREDVGCRGTSCYFKAGAYTQSHVGQHRCRRADDFGEALFRSIVVEVDRV